MNEAETRAELIGPAIKAAGLGVVEAVFQKIMLKKVFAGELTGEK